MKPKTLILFDYGGVIANDHQDPAEIELMEIFRATRPEIDSLLSEKSDHGRLFREGRITEQQFWSHVSTKAGVFPQNDIKELTLLFSKTYTINEELMKLIGKLKVNCRVGILTNIDIARSSYLINELGIEKLFDYYFPSHRFGFSKSQPALWDKIDEICTLEYLFEKIIYIDDRIEHVNSANGKKWIGLQYRGISQLSNDLLEMGY